MSPNLPTELTYLEIHLDHITANVQTLRSHIGGERLICGVVKANAYGHGLIPVAKHLINIGVEWLAVVSLPDLIALRQAGITHPILLMTVVHPADLNTAMHYQATPFISSIEELLYWQAEAKRLQQGLSFHLKMNSQMNRLGLESAQLDAFLQQLNQEPFLKLTGVALHFAQADTPDLPNMQDDIAMLMQIKETLDARYPDLVYHLASSLAVRHYPQSVISMIRPGIALYGYELPHLKPALSWISHIIHIRRVPAHTPISYGAIEETTKACDIAVIPVGYADGYPREFIHTPYIIINDKPYPLIGRVCMNQLMVNLGEHHNIKRFDKVYLLHPTHFTAQHLAEASGTISYRILTGLSQHLPRRYSSSSAQEQ